MTSDSPVIPDFPPLTHDRRRVLVVDDSAVIQQLVRARLSVDGFDVAAVASGQEALQCVHTFRPDVILLDIDMPDMDGYDTCRELKSRAETHLIPVIFLTAKAGVEDKVRGLDLGAIDYVTKPFDSTELRARVRSAHRTKFMFDRLEEKSQVDGLTGLFTRAHFLSRFREELERARRYSVNFAIVLLDVDRFKKLNDGYGHLFGDCVLSEVADMLQSASRTVDIVSRYGGEEFVVLLPGQGLDRAARYAERLRIDIGNAVFRHDNDEIRVTASFGIASSDSLGYSTPEEFIGAADKALYAAKEQGRNRVCLWTKDGPVPASAYAAVTMYPSNVPGAPGPAAEPST